VSKKTSVHFIWSKGLGCSKLLLRIWFELSDYDYRHDIYKWHSDQTRARKRAVSFHALNAPQDPAFEHIHEPGGFRRNYMKLRATEQGTEEPPMLDNFIDFLTLFGHFVSSTCF
jgi:hypothetical protein